MVEADRLRAQAAQLDDEAALLMEAAKGKRQEAATLRARAERHDEPERAVKVTHTALSRVRKDGLLAAAGVACESLAPGFTASDLAGALGIRDEARAMRLLLAVAELGHVIRLPAGGWACESEAEMHVRDYVIEAGEFTLADVIALGYTEDEAAGHVESLRARGIIDGQAGHYTYVDVIGTSPARERRRPPEKEPPAGTESRAQGKAVRVVNHGKRGQQMQGGNRRHVIRRDQNRERMEAAREAKAAARRAAQADAKNERGRRVR